MAPSADKSAKTLFFALDVGHLTLSTCTLKSNSTAALISGLVASAATRKIHLFVFVGNVCALFRHHGGEQNLHQTLLIEPVCLIPSCLVSGCAHASISSNLATRLGDQRVVEAQAS